MNLQKKCLVTVELLDPQTHSIIMQNEAISGMSDYVLSNNTVSKVLAMIAESREVKIVLRELLGSKGCDVSIYPLQRYVHFDNDGKRSKDKHSYWEKTRKRLNFCLIKFLKNTGDCLTISAHYRPSPASAKKVASGKFTISLGSSTKFSESQDADQKSDRNKKKDAFAFAFQVPLASAAVRMHVLF